MSHMDSIRNLIKIKDVNILFENEFAKVEIIDDIKTTVIRGTLTYNPDS